MKEDRGQDALLALYTARALLATDGYRKLLRPDACRRTPLDIVGLSGLKASSVTPDKARKKLVKRLRVLEAALPRGSSGGCAIARNVAALGGELGLDATERDLLVVATLAASEPPFAECLDDRANASLRRTLATLAEVIGRDASEVGRALTPSSVLASTGLVKLADPQQRRWDDPLELMDGLADALAAETATVESLVALFVRRSPEPRVTLDDFPHLGGARAVASRLVAAAATGRARGVNVLLHGKPGNGKTELARALARHAGLTPYEIPVADAGGAPLEGETRVSAYGVAQRLLARRGGSVVLFDEMEDAFPRSAHDHSATRFKGFVNRMLEENDAPSIWISNAVQHLDPAIVRRFDLVLEVGVAPERVRRRVLERHLAAVAVRAPWIVRASRDERVTPALAERAAKVATILGEDDVEVVEAALDCVVDGQLAAIGVTRRAADVPRAYDLAFVRASEDLEALADALASRPRGNLCLYGAPGTGKTAFVAHVAERAGKPLIARRASDILGMYVGETEANLARMFAEATSAGAILLLDEADSFLGDRASATRSWEVSQVNEILVQMEAFSGLFFCATNLFERLDLAALRRFAIKVRFDAPSAAQRWALFARVLEAQGADVDPALRRGLDRLDGVTPGDFAAATKRAEILGRRLDGPGLLASLEGEVAARRRGARAALGFAS